MQLRRGRGRGLALAAMVLPAACAAQTAPDNAAICDAYHNGRSHVEVVAQGTITRVLGVAQGRTSPHEGLLIRLDSACRVTVRIEANADFTGTFAIAPGERTVVKGEYEYYPIGGVIHWTHRDPRGRHEAGFVEVGGRTYD